MQLSTVSKAYQPPLEASTIRVKGEAPTVENRSGASGDTTPETPQSGEAALNDPKVKELQAIDTAVRAHEAAHMAAGGGVVTGGASFSYARGPDGKMYAVGGEVPIDASEGSNPEETISKAQRIRAAALAPSDPSPQDYKVAATAIMMEQNARIEQMRQLQAELEGPKQYEENRIGLDEESTELN